MAIRPLTGGNDVKLSPHLSEGTSRADGQIHKVPESDSWSQERKQSLSRHRELLGKQDSTSRCYDIRSKVFLWTLARVGEHLSDMNETRCLAQRKTVTNKV